MKPVAVLTTVPSDSHNWNLIFMELLLEETGFHVVNLGACVPHSLLADACNKYQPDVIVVSTINGHGFIEGKQLIDYIRQYLSGSLSEIFIGGKLSTDITMSALYAAELEQAGYTKAYIRNEDLPEFKSRLLKICTSSARSEGTSVSDFLSR